MRIGLLVAVLALSTSTAWGQAVIWATSAGGNGHAYEFVSDALWWDEARAAASARTPPPNFRPGTLVTIGSAEENVFVNQIRDNRSTWLGFTDEAIEGEWRWIDDTPGVWQDPTFFSTPVQTAYVNWSAGEPNNWGGNEDYGISDGTWNDGTMRGGKYTYVVEYRATSAPAPGTTTSATTAWTNWSSNSQGAIATPTGNVSVTYAGELRGTENLTWAPASTYADGAYVANAPPANSPAIRLFGGDNSVRTVAFAKPVLNPVIAIWSLGNSGQEARFVFDQTPTYVSGGPSSQTGEGAITLSGRTVSAWGGNGTLLFPGTHTYLSWTNPNYEYFYGFTVGISGGMALAIQVNSGTQTQEQAGYTLLSGAGSFEKVGAGTLVLDRVNTFTGDLLVQAGTVHFANASALRDGGLSPLVGGVVTLSPGMHASVGRLAVNAGGLIDIGTGKITVHSGLTGSAVTAAILAGQATGTSGIISSAAALRPDERTIGWLDNGDGSMTFGYAAPGDGTLDGMVDIMDIAYFLASGKYSTPLLASWRDGDYNYDGMLDDVDIAAFLSTGLYNTGNYVKLPESIAAVPEPSAPALVGIGLACAAWAARRRFR